MTELNIIGDIAGQYHTLRALLKKMPDCPTILVGDMCDRGPRSRAVFEYAMSEPGHILPILGNHEQMLLQYTGNDPHWAASWMLNGGRQTLKNYPEGIPESLTTWLKALPLYRIYDDLVVTHAPMICEEESIQYSAEMNPEFFVWNRNPPPHRMKRFQIYGHNSWEGFRGHRDEQGPFALCIDTSQQDILTGIHWPTRTVYQQAYID